MTLYTLGSIVLTIAVLIGYINHRFIKMQTTIAIMSGSLVFSLILIIIGQFGFVQIEAHVTTMLGKIDFHSLLINGMLSFLLFAGALTIDVNTFKNQKWEIGILASVSTIASAFLVGIATYYVLHWLGFRLNFIYCMLFGALISPTDPIAVLATFKQIGAPKQLDVTVAGESLFNDGVGIVIFLTLYQLAFAGKAVTTGAVILLFLQQAIGGILYGAIIGLIAYWLIKPIDDHKIEILITLMIVTGGYAFAQALDISGPLAMVVAGIFIGNRGRNFSMSKKTRESLDNFWELVDEILNAVLFLLIGFELLTVHFNHHYLLAAFIAIPLVLCVRFITVSIPMQIFKLKRKYTPFFTTILVWGGLRGGLAVALALALPANDHRNLILAMTYAVVMFAVIVQGLTVKHLVYKTRGS